MGHRKVIAADALLQGKDCRLKGGFFGLLMGPWYGGVGLQSL